MEPAVRQSPVRFYEIDLLRFLAALGVVFYHYTYRGYMADGYSPVAYPALGRFTKYGYLGVELFFLISGYVVLRSAQGKTVRQFFLSRFTRLYPAFWAACTLTFGVERSWGTHLPPQLHAGLGQYVYSMTMLHEFFGISAVDGVYWSLTIEITFYFLIAVLIGFKLLRHVEGFIISWLIYSALPNIEHGGTLFAQLLFPNYAPYFMAGMLFYLLQQPQGRRWGRYALLLGAYLLAVKATIAKAASLSMLFHDEISGKVAAVLITVFFILFGLISTRTLNLGRHAWLAWPGALTYPLYLLHNNIGFILFHRLADSLDKYVLLSSIIGLMLGLAYLVHRLVEKSFSQVLGQQASQWLTALDRR